MPLSAQLLAALENLGRKKAGEDVDWINIADARALTDLGLAEPKDRDRPAFANQIADRRYMFFNFT